MLESLLISKTRVKILSLFFTHLDEKFHVRGITRQVEEEINAVRRELARLLKVGLLKKESKGNRVYYSLKKDFPLFPELLRLVAKSEGFGKLILKEVKNFGNVKYIMLSGHLYYGRVASQNEVDLLIVGSVAQSKVAKLVKQAEKFFGHEINYTILSEEEFNFRKERHDPFVSSVLTQSRIMLWGNEEEFLA